MDSVPPATMQSAPPAAIRSAAVAMACRPEAQNRFTVWPGTSTGRPARSAATRATFIPASPSGNAQPRITSSTRRASTRVRSSRARMTEAARSSGRTSRSFPFFALPPGVRTAARMYAAPIPTSGSD